LSVIRNEEREFALTFGDWSTVFFANASRLSLFTRETRLFDVGVSILKTKITRWD